MSIRLDSPTAPVVAPTRDQGPAPSTSASVTKTPADVTTSPATPAQKTDAAYATYQQAIAHRTEAMKEAIPNAYEHGETWKEESAKVDTAKKQLDDAVASEIGPQVDASKAGVPPQYQRPTGDMVDSYGKAILARHADDPTAQTVLQQSVGDYKAARTAQDLIPAFYGDFTPLNKLQSLHSSLAGQPQAVVDKAMADPRVQQWLTDAKAWVAEPYKGVSADGAKEDQQAATDASKRLADVTATLPPDAAAALVRDSMPTIQKIAGVDANYSGAGAFTNLSRVVGSLGDSPDARSLTTQIAQAYGPQLKDWSGRFEDPNIGIVRNAVADGASPTLALELAAQLKSAGKPDEAGAILRSAARGVDAVKSDIQSDMKEFAEYTQELNWLVKNAGPDMTPAQLQTAIKHYIDGKGPEWQQKLTELQTKIVDDVRTLRTDAAQLDGLPDDMKSLAPDAMDGLKNVLEDDQVQSAIMFAANKDPGIFEGKEGGEFGVLLVELGHKAKDLTSTVAKAYVSGNVVPALGQLNPNDPASVAKANAVLDDFQQKASRLLGISQTEVDAGVAELRKMVGTLKTTKSIDEAVKNLHALDDLKKELGELKETTFSTAGAGLAFRTIALGLSGAALLNQANKTIDDPNAQNVIGTLAFSVGLAQDSAGFASTLKLLDSEGALGGWGLASSTAGVLTEKFIGVLNAGYFAAGALQELGKDDPNAGIVAFDTAGAGGALLATFGEAAGLGSWAGPVGVAVMALATAGVALFEWRGERNEHSEAARKFFEGAGIEENTAKVLTGDALDEAGVLRGDLGLSPTQLQELAEQHPEVFYAPGYAQAFAEVAKANGIDGEDVAGFADALSKDNPDYMTQFFNQRVGSDGTHPDARAQGLLSLVQSSYPNAAAYVRAHSPELFGHDADARAKADRDYEGLSSKAPPDVGNLFKSNSDPAYQAELVKVLKDQGMLDVFVQMTSTNYAYNGWDTAAKTAIEHARDAGVLSADEAGKYLSQYP